MEDFPIFIIMVRKHHKILTTCILQKHSFFTKKHYRNPRSHQSKNLNGIP